MSKNVFVVIGMARSGTSAIARGLQAIGIELGDKLTPGSKKWNPKGFFEDSDIVYKINRGLLHKLDHEWTGISLLSKENFDYEGVHEFKNLAISLLKERMKNTDYWGFKDPRTAKLLPFWQMVFAQLNLNERYVIALRNPLSSAYSYQRVAHVDIETGLLLWLMHLIPAIDETQGKKRVVINYDAILSDSHHQLLRLKHQLNIPDLVDASEINQYAKQFLDRKLQHFDYDERTLRSHPAMPIAPLCYTVYELLKCVAKDEMDLESSSFSNAWQEVKTEFEKIYPVYTYIDSLLKKNKKMERELRSIRRSLPWKLFYPLRIIDDALRAMRRKAREKRRLVITNG